MTIDELNKKNPQKKILTDFAIFRQEQENQKKRLRSLQNEVSIPDKLFIPHKTSRKMKDILNLSIKPTIREQANPLRDAELGRMTASAVALPKGDRLNTYGINGNTISYKSPTGRLTDQRNNSGVSNIEHRFRNAVQGDNSGTRAEQKRQFDARHQPIPLLFRIAQETPQKPEPERMPRFTAPGFKGAEKAARIHSQKQQWLRERRKAADLVNLANINERGDMNRTRLMAEMSQNQNILQAKQQANQNALLERGRNDRARADREARKMNQKPVINEANKLKFRKNLDEGYATYLANTNKLDNIGKPILPKDKWIQQTYDPETLSGYGYKSSIDNSSVDNYSGVDTETAIDDYINSKL